MLFQLLKNVSNWVFKQLDKSGKAMNDADDRMIASMYLDTDERK
jgi:hypothetical protein